MCVSRPIMPLLRFAPHPCLVLVSLSFAACAPTPETTTDAPAIIGGSTTDDYPDVGRVTSGCTATLVHPRAMLTAAHCCQRETSCKRVTIGGRTIDVTAKNHPDFAVAEGGGITPSVDIALLFLDEPVEDIAPRKLASSLPAAGRPIRFVGFGCSAFGGAGSGIKRTGTNEVAFWGSNVSGGDRERFADVFGWHSRPVDGGTPNDDANICPGDSGGPTFWTEGGEAVLAGIHTLVGPTFGYSCLVTARRDWIDENLRALDGS